jgi:CheY-like chemotaxis protein
MAIFGFGKDKKDGGGNTELVLAYLEDAQRSRASFTLVGARKAEAAATIQAIDEAEGVVTFQTQLHTEKGARIEFFFLAESLRLGGAATVVDLRPGLVLAGLPEALELKERRSQPRARLNPKEGTTLTALTGLFDGVGINGVVENLSEGGARIRVEKAMNLKGEKRLPLGSALVPPGQPFMMIKLNKAPKCQAVMELTGRAVFLDGSAGGLCMGIAFDSLRTDQAAALRGLVASRTSPIPASVPAKARRRAENPPPEPSRAAEEPRPEPAREPRPAVEVQPARQPDPPEAPPAAPAQAPRIDALTRLKRRSRAVVALAPSPAFADVLKEHLQEEGYGRILVTHLANDLPEFLQQPNLGILFLDGNFSTLDALQYVTTLKAGSPDLPPVILAVEDASTAVVLAARRSGVAQILVKPYTLDAGFSELVGQFF